MKILIATPVYDETVTTLYMLSVHQMITHLAPRAELVPYFMTSSVIHRTRNAFASVLLEEPSYTHLLFIDSDMGFRPQAVERMIDLDKDMAGCIYPRRHVDMGRLQAVSRQIDDAYIARMVALDYVGAAELVVDDVGEGRKGLKLDRGFVRTRGIGGGLTLIKRGVFERMLTAYPKLAAPPDANYRGMHVRERVFQCFEPVQREDGLFLSEDLAFCRRWTDIGGEIWACIDETITHAGRVQVQGRYADQLVNLSKLR